MASSDAGIAVDVVYPDNTNLIQVCLRNTYDRTPINDATVTATITDMGGAALPGDASPYTGVYQAGTDGEYLIEIPTTITLPLGRQIKAIVDASSAGLNYKGTKLIYVKARKTDGKCAV